MWIKSALLSTPTDCVLFRTVCCRTNRRCFRSHVQWTKKGIFLETFGLEVPQAWSLLWRAGKWWWFVVVHTEHTVTRTRVHIASHAHTHTHVCMYTCTYTQEHTHTHTCTPCILVLHIHCYTYACMHKSMPHTHKRRTHRYSARFSGRRRSIRGYVPAYSATHQKRTFVSSGFSAKGTWISASSEPHCGFKYSEAKEETIHTPHFSLLF